MHALLLHLFDIIWVSNIYSHLNLLIMELFKRDFQLGFVLILFVILFSCSSDDVLEKSDGIVGKWMLKEMKMELRTTEDGETMISTGVGTNNSPENYVVFKDDNTFSGKSGTMEMAFTGSVNGEEFNYSQSVGSDIPGQGKWSKEGDKITISDTEETSVYIIQTLSKSTLKLYGDHTLNDFSEDDDFSEGDYFKMTLIYSRL